MVSQNSETSTEPLRVFDLSASDCPSIAVVMAVSEQADVDPTEITPLQSVIDTDAIDALFRAATSAPSRTGTLQFEYLGYSVLLDSQQGYLYERADRSVARAGAPEHGVSAEVD